MTDLQRDQILQAIVPGGWLANVVSGFPLFGAAMVLIAGVLVVGSEYGWSTMGIVMTQGPGRIQVLAGKLDALAVVTVAFELVVFLPGAVASSVIGGALDAPANWPGVAEVIEVFAAGFLIFFTWAVLGALLAVLFRGTSLPIGLGLVWLLVVEGPPVSPVHLTCSAPAGRACPGPMAGRWLRPTPRSAWPRRPASRP